MAKQALDGRRLNAFAMDPDDLVIVGLDTNDGTEHLLCDEESNRMPLDEADILYVMAEGVLASYVLAYALGSVRRETLIDAQPGLVELLDAAEVGKAEEK